MPDSTSPAISSSVTDAASMGHRSVVGSGTAAPGEADAASDVGATWRRAGLVVVGWTLVVLAAVGAVLPVLPTTPFLLLAAACFARSSRRFHGWLTTHRVFGGLIRDWQAHRALPRRTKWWAVSAFVVTIGVSIAVVPLMPVKVGLSALATVLLAVLLRLPVR